MKSKLEELIENLKRNSVAVLFLWIFTKQKLKFFTKDFRSKLDQICSFLWILSHLLIKPFMKSFTFCTVIVKCYSTVVLCGDSSPSQANIFHMMIKFTDVGQTKILTVTLCLDILFGLSNFSCPKINLVAFLQGFYNLILKCPCYTEVTKSSKDSNFSKNLVFKVFAYIFHEYGILSLQLSFTSRF